MSPRRIAPLLASTLLASLVVVVATTGENTPAAAQAGGPEPPIWENCGYDEPPQDDFECATIAVPLDHAEPDGQQVHLALLKAPATDPENRIGSLFFNPGGPGAPGKFMVAEEVAPGLEGPIRERFDLIGFDPRGVGDSAPSPDCDLPESEVDPLEVGWESFYQQALTNQDQYRTACSVSMARYRDVVGTNQVVEDIDWMRRALGEDQINYWGVSYGTRLGEDYAQRYPQNVRAMVLEGNVNPHSTLTEFFYERGGSYDDAFGLFADTFPEAGQQFEDLYERLLEGPLPAPDGELTRREFITFVFGGLANENVWPAVAERIGFIHSEVFGSGAEVLTASNLTAAAEPGNPPSLMNAGIQTAVNCIDLPGKPTAAEMPSLAEQMVAAGPYFGELMAAQFGMCHAFPVTEDPVPSTSPPTLPPILLTGAIYDPATPYEWSEQLHAFLPGSVLLTYGGAQHGPRLRDPDCIGGHMDTYLVDLTLPPPDTTCPFVPPVGPPEI